MAVVTPETNGVGDNVAAAIGDLEKGVSVALVIRGLLMRDVRAMLEGGPEQAQHFRDVASALNGSPIPSVRTTYVEFHFAYRSGWSDIIAASGRHMIDERKIEALTLAQTSAAEGVVKQVANGAIELETAVDWAAECLSAYFMTITEPA